MNVEGLTELNTVVVAAGDWSATRTVYGVVIALGVIGLTLIVLAIWLIKQTKPEPELLAPLERMDDRSWRKQEPAQMRRDLDSLRPAGARPVAREKGVPNIDEDFAQSRPKLANFDDLQAQLAADIRRSASDAVDPVHADAEPEPAEPAGDAEAGVVGGLAAPVAGDAVGSADDSSGREDLPTTDASDQQHDDDTGDTSGDDTGDIAVDEFDIRPGQAASDEHEDTA